MIYKNGQQRHENKNLITPAGMKCLSVGNYKIIDTFVN
jgi:hypothetical protein